VHVIRSGCTCSSLCCVRVGGEHCGFSSVYAYSLKSSNSYSGHLFESQQASTYVVHEHALELSTIHVQLQGESGRDRIASDRDISFEEKQRC
jgi:hypothetical protein